MKGFGLTNSKLDPRPFEMMGYTVEEYQRWCIIHKKPSYALATKREFFRLVREHKIRKVKGKVTEDADGGTRNV